MSDTYKSLGVESIMANSIMKYVLAHPDEKDPFEAFNNWVTTEAILKHFPVGDQEKMKLAYEWFDLYINKCPRETLVLCQDIEEEETERSKRELALILSSMKHN